MARKKTSEETVAETNTVPTFTKKQFVESYTFGKYRDFLNAQLENGKSYTKAEVAEKIESTFKVKLNIN